MGVVQAGGAAGVLGAVGQGHAVVGGRHLGVADEPAMEVGVLLVAAAAGGGGSGGGGGGSGPSSPEHQGPPDPGAPTNS